MNSHPSDEVTCPLAAVDRRLADAHRLWHQAAAAYFDPEEFRIAIQNTIQALRSVTFILQRQKDIIPDFAVWYGDYVNEKKGKRGKWQERLHIDPLMQWLVTARNIIEKEGDLASQSFVRAEILASYLDDGPRIEVASHLFDSALELLRSIPEDALGHHIKKNGALQIQRRWVAANLPDYELLDAVAVSYGKFSELVHDAHRQIGLNLPQTLHDDEGKNYDLPSMGWRLPCMIAHDAPRTLIISLADGSCLEFEDESVVVAMDAETVGRLVNQYGDNVFDGLAQTRDGKDNTALAAAYFEIARTVFLRDRHHGRMIIFFRDHKPIGHHQIIVENVLQKYVMMRQLAAEITKTGADSAIAISEIWSTPADQLRLYERPAESAVRREGLALEMVSKDGDPLYFYAEIKRDGEQIALGETGMFENATAFDFVPFYQAWGRPVPQSWLDVNRLISEHAKREDPEPPQSFSAGNAPSVPGAS